MLRNEAIFLNGVFESVLLEILKVQEALPEQIMFLQPYKASRIVELAENPPSPSDAVRLFVSTTDELNVVRFTGEIVGWDNKSELPQARANVIRRLLWTLQPDEGGLYDLAQSDTGESINLLHVWRLRPLRTPFSVTELTLLSTGQPHSANRTTAGGWSYVQNPGETWLQSYL